MASTSVSGELSSTILSNNSPPSTLRDEHDRNRSAVPHDKIRKEERQISSSTVEQMVWQKTTLKGGDRIFTTHYSSMSITWFLSSNAAYNCRTLAWLSWFITCISFPAISWEGKTMHRIQWSYLKWDPVSHHFNQNRCPMLSAIHMVKCWSNLWCMHIIFGVFGVALPFLWLFVWRWSWLPTSSQWSFLYICALCQIVHCNVKKWGVLHVRFTR